MTGRHLDAEKHICTEFGAYVQAHEEHSNDMQSQIICTICLGPSGNEQGGHYFMSHHWTDLPMPGNAID
jgi:hypothetical protein